MTNMMTIRTAAPGTERCDFHDLNFYRSDPPRWAYPASDFSIGMIVDPSTNSTEKHVSAGAWAACDPCHALIESGDFAALALRAVAGLDGSERALVLPLLRDFQQRFREHRTGPATPM